MEQDVYSNIGLYLRFIREKRSQKSIVNLAKDVRVDKNTLQGYETSRTLPDVDFLAVFAKQTGSGFNELLQIRLASGKSQEARDLAERLKPARPLQETAELENRLESLGDDLDLLIEGAEIEADGDGHLAFVDEPEKDEFVSKIKSLLINGTAIKDASSNQSSQINHDLATVLMSYMIEHGLLKKEWERHINLFIGLYSALSNQPLDVIKIEVLVLNTMLRSYRDQLDQFQIQVTKGDVPHGVLSYEEVLLNSIDKIEKQILELNISNMH